MYRSDIAARVLVLAAVAAASLVTASACQLGDGSCLRMSDCETGWQCVEGTCRTDEAPATPADGGAAPSVAADARAERPRVVVTSDAASDDDASSTDGGPTDAASDR